jgi:hypothetical protein
MSPLQRKPPARPPKKKSPAGPIDPGPVSRFIPDGEGGFIVYCNAASCTNQFKTSESVSPKIRFTCREHTPSGADHARFQAYELDPDLSKSTKTPGTEQSERVRIRIELNPEGGFFVYCNVDGCREYNRTNDPTDLHFICCIHRAEQKFGARVHFQPYQFYSALKRNSRPTLRFEIGEFILPDVLFPVSTLNPGQPPAESLDQRLDPGEFLVNDTPTYRETCPYEYSKETPSWVYDDGAINCLLVGKYTKLASQWSALQKAVRWNCVIRLYFRLGWSAGDVAQFINTDTDTVENLVRAIRKAGERLRKVEGKWKYNRPARKVRSIGIQSESTTCGGGQEEQVA